MSRRIVQLQVSAIANELTGETWDHVYALDNNGVAWLLRSPDAQRWERLPALPSFENRTPTPATVAPPAATDEGGAI